MSKTKEKKHLLLAVILVLLFVSVGYAAFSQNLRIIGTASAAGSFKLEFVDYEITNKVGVISSSASLSEDKETLIVNMNLEYPGAGGILKAKIKNTGTMAAKLDNISFSGLLVNGVQADDSQIEISYTGLEEDDVLLPDESQEVDISIKWKDNSDEPEETVFSITLEYSQYTASFVPASGS